MRYTTAIGTKPHLRADGSTSPDGGTVPVRQLIVVVFPAPLGPSRQNSWPLGMAK